MACQKHFQVAPHTKTIDLFNAELSQMWNKEPFTGYGSKQVEFDMNVGEVEHEK